MCHKHRQSRINPYARYHLSTVSRWLRLHSNENRKLYKLMCHHSEWWFIWLTYLIHHPFSRAHAHVECRMKYASVSRHNCHRGNCTQRNFACIRISWIMILLTGNWYATFATAACRARVRHSNRINIYALCWNKQESSLWRFFLSMSTYAKVASYSVQFSVFAQLVEFANSRFRWTNEHKFPMKSVISNISTRQAAQDMWHNKLQFPLHFWLHPANRRIASHITSRECVRHVAPSITAMLNTAPLTLCLSSRV